MPIGTVIAWPFGSAPLGLHNDHWLECNGQEVKQAEYPRLYELLMNTTGKNLVPDYQGMFLRGLGSQNYSQRNGAYHGTTSTTYRSGDLGATQGDAMRSLTAYIGYQTGAAGYYDRGGWEHASYAYADSAVYMDYSLPFNGASFPAGAGFFTNSSDGFSKSWYDALTKYKTTPDRLHVTTSNVEGVGSVVTGVSLDSPEEIHPSLFFNEPQGHMYFSSDIQLPTAEEIRPVNKAVRYMIKAK